MNHEYEGSISGHVAKQDPVAAVGEIIYSPESLGQAARIANTFAEALGGTVMIASMVSIGTPAKPEVAQPMQQPVIPVLGGPL